MQVLGRRLHQHPPEPAARVLGGDGRGHQQHGVAGDRGRRETGRPRDEVGRGVGDVAGRGAVDVRDPPDAAPLQQGRGHPGLLVQRGVAALVRPLGEDRVQLPEEAGPAGVGQVVQPVERQRQQLTPAHAAPHPRGPRRGTAAACRGQAVSRETGPRPRDAPPSSWALMSDSYHACSAPVHPRAAPHRKEDRP